MEVFTALVDEFQDRKFLVSFRTDDRILTDISKRNIFEDLRTKIKTYA